MYGVGSQSHRRRCLELTRKLSSSYDLQPDFRYKVHRGRIYVWITNPSHGSNASGRGYWLREEAALHVPNIGNFLLYKKTCRSEVLLFFLGNSKQEVSHKDLSRLVGYSRSSVEHTLFDWLTFGVVKLRQAERFTVRRGTLIKLKPRKLWSFVGGDVICP